MSTSKTTPKRIVKLNVQDFLRLYAVEITPTGNVVTLGGRNGAGKSSVLDAIQAALAGGRAVPDKPIRDGAERAEISVDLGDIIVTRTITAGGDRLVVKSRDGATYGSPQKLLNELFAAIAFDPLEFARMKPDQQAETLRRITRLDTSVLDAEHASAFDERTGIGREVKVLQGRLVGMPVHDGAPAEEVSIGDLTTEYERLQGVARSGERLERVVANTKRALDDADQEAREIAAGIARLERDLEVERKNAAFVAECVAARRAELAAAEAALAAFVPPNLDAVATQLKAAEGINRKVRENTERARVANQWEAAAARHVALTGQIDAVAVQKRDAIARAVSTLSVPGLLIDQDGVALNGHPFAQASTAEKIRVSLAVGAASNPGLRVLFVRDGSLLDPDGLALVAKLAAEHDLQIFVEDARTTDPTAVIIEDGRVLAPVHGNDAGAAADSAAQ